MGQPIELSKEDFPAVSNELFAAVVRAESYRRRAIDLNNLEQIPGGAAGYFYILASEPLRSSKQDLTSILLESHVLRMQFENMVEERDVYFELEAALSEATEQIAIKRRLALVDGANPGLLDLSLQR